MPRPQQGHVESPGLALRIWGGARCRATQPGLETGGPTLAQGNVIWRSGHYSVMPWSLASLPGQRQSQKGPRVKGRAGDLTASLESQAPTGVRAVVPPLPASARRGPGGTSQPLGLGAGAGRGRRGWAALLELLRRHHTQRPESG